MEWTHSNWWGFILTLLRQRRGFFPTPLLLVWCPARLLEHIPSFEVTEADAIEAGSTRQDIVLNRLADHVAKQHINDLAKAIKTDLTVKENDVFARQLWLAKLNRVCKQPEQPVPSQSLAAVEPAPPLSALPEMALGYFT